MHKLNRLRDEQSPYLLQHADNPVDWYPWGEEAFQKAKAEDKPVFLSIGYSTCHWCHVMAEESFQDEEVAAALNRDFIAIKVDREERPDIDAVYMDVCQAITGSGGWPLTVFLTPEQKPFYAGTYYPKHQRHGYPGVMELLAAIVQLWKTDREHLLASGDKILAALAEPQIAGSAALDQAAVKQAAIHLKQRYDAQDGGFGRAPKFPMPHNLLFLLRCHQLGIEEKALEMVEHTLQAMYRGGIFDHIGGGFSRYSTDNDWLAPHFEKMLYDNALLTMAYTEAYQLTQNELYAGIVERILRYVEREMTLPEGGFCSAQDADSEGEEGKYYTFTQQEIFRVLGEQDGKTFCAEYGITPQGNFEGKNIPNRLDQPATLPDLSLQRMQEQLYDYRSCRYRLHKDDKVLTSWNALMIAAYAKAYRALGKEGYLCSAQNAFLFLEQHLTAPDGRLWVSYRAGKANGYGLLEDYAFFAWACLELYESTFHIVYLERACALMKTVLAKFSSTNGGFYLSPEDGETLVLRPKEMLDGAMPSGNSVAAWCLVRLAALTGEKLWQETADQQLMAYHWLFQRQPSAATFALTALMQLVYPTWELICMLSDTQQKAEIAKQLGAIAHPQTAILVISPDDRDRIAQLAPFVKNYPVPAAGTTYYLCQNRQCAAPVTSLEQVKAALYS